MKVLVVNNVLTLWGAGSACVNQPASTCEQECTFCSSTQWRQLNESVTCSSLSLVTSHIKWSFNSAEFHTRNAWWNTVSNSQKDTNANYYTISWSHTMPSEMWCLAQWITVTLVADSTIPKHTQHADPSIIHDGEWNSPIPPSCERYTLHFSEPSESLLVQSVKNVHSTGNLQLKNTSTYERDPIQSTQNHQTISNGT
jgi:hypothetical protein